MSRDTVPFWLTAFIDCAPGAGPDQERFWSEVTGQPPSERRGDHGEFITLLPEAGDACVRMQRLGSGPSRIHVDVHVVDPRAAAADARALGGVVVADRGYVAMRSPGGLPLCFVTHPAAVAPPPREGAGGRSRIHQLCLDIPAGNYHHERAFWAGVLQRKIADLPTRPEYEWALPPHGMALGLLLQQLEEPDTGPVTAHLDIGAGDRAAEVRRHVGLGAAVLGEFPFWTVLRDPAGLRYCVTDRDPDTDLLP